MKKIIQVLKKIIQKFITIVQKILITILLVLIYLFGFGFTFLFTMCFNRKALGISSIKKDTFWIKSENDDSLMDNCLRPS
ncbi:MAG: hypothetical protein PHT50_02625 [Candidatus Omnitrophica bacterium]|nr:hypothetical protein [Candidatus Omnitrophota bacterium]